MIPATPHTVKVLDSGYVYARFTLHVWLQVPIERVGGELDDEYMHGVDEDDRDRLRDWWRTYVPPGREERSGS